MTGYVVVPDDCAAVQAEFEAGGELSVYLPRVNGLPADLGNDDAGSGDEATGDDAGHSGRENDDSDN